MIDTETIMNLTEKAKEKREGKPPIQEEVKNALEVILGGIGTKQTFVWQDLESLNGKNFLLQKGGKAMLYYSIGDGVCSVNKITNRESLSINDTIVILKALKEIASKKLEPILF